MASQSHVLMLQEAVVPQPIDYRDVVRAYSGRRECARTDHSNDRGGSKKLQESRFVPITLLLKPLEKIDLGDLAAENEIRGLRSYFVPTAQYSEAKRGHARLVVGRKGTGKTAIFWYSRNAYKRSRPRI